LNRIRYGEVKGFVDTLSDPQVNLQRIQIVDNTILGNGQRLEHGLIHARSPRHTLTKTTTRPPPEPAGYGSIKSPRGVVFG